jgi:hypothetical protein
MKMDVLKARFKLLYFAEQKNMLWKPLFIRLPEHRKRLDLKIRLKQ